MFNISNLKPACSSLRVRARRTSLAALLLILVVFWLPRIGLVDGPSLWADEIFSLAMATGHSLEHPASVANPDRGDFVEVSRPTAPSFYARYLEHERPAVPLRRVLRAVLLSDTSPPLYYLMLYGWTRLLGTGDAALRLFSVGWALACLPLMAAIARRLGGDRAAVPACLLFAASPLCVYYSTEGRMYSMLWFFVLAAAWCTIKLNQDGPHLAWTAMWAVSSVGGFMTHYFFVFPWLAYLAWILVHPGKFPRRFSLIAASLTVAVILPWYVRLPESLAGWRVTQNWLKVVPDGHTRMKFFLAPLTLFVQFFSVPGGSIKSRGAALAVFGVSGLVIALRDRARWASGRRMMLWLWLVAALIGPLVFDRLRGTYTYAVPRYAIAGMPAAFLLVAVGLGRLTKRTRLVLLSLIILAWTPGLRRMNLNNARLTWEPFKKLGRDLAERTGPFDVVVVHSIPSGVVGIARYMDANRASVKGVGFASWVGQLGRRRVPEDLESLAAGHRRVILVKIHTVGEPAPEEEWLKEHGKPIGERRLQTATVLDIVPRNTDRFFEPAP